MQPNRYGPFPFEPLPHRQKLRWPNGKRIALWVVPNIEIFHLDVPMPGDSQERPKGGEPTPMVRQWAQRDYGNRVGVWRMMDVMAKHGVRGTVSLNSDVCIHMPTIIDACLELDWELMGHGRTNTHRMNEIPPDTERQHIKEVFDTIEAKSGKRPVGWLGPGLQETWNTLEYLVDSGCRYVGDWVNDDRPYVMDVSGQRLVSVPYSFELNDSPAIWRNKQPMPEFERMVCDAFDVLYEESATDLRVIAICLHPFIIGQAHRIKSLDRVLAYILKHEGVWAATGAEICNAYLEALDGG